jgi:hypothetical protein
MGKRFRVRDGKLAWTAPDRFEVEVTLDIADSEAFRHLLQEYNSHHPELAERITKASVENPDPDAIDEYLNRFFEEYLRA